MKNILIKLNTVKYFLTLLILVLCSIFFMRVESDENLSMRSEIKSGKTVEWNLPRQDNKFVGRKDILRKLTEEFQSVQNKKDEKTQIVAVCNGLAGIGKTQLALEYANHTPLSYTLKIWFSAETTQQLYETYSQFAKAIGYKVNQPSLEAVRDYVKYWLENHPGWLLILDNVPDYETIIPFLPQEGGHVLITTRHQKWPDTFYSIPLDVMSEEDAILMIETITQLTAQENKELAKELGYLPLALAQASAYIRENGKTTAQYLTLYRQYENKMISNKTMPVGTNHVPVAVTWNTSLDAIEADSKRKGYLPLDRTLLTVCAYLAPVQIPRKLLLSWLEINYPELGAREIKLDQTLGQLHNYSLIHMDPEGENLSIHRLLQSTIRHQQSDMLNYNQFFLSFRKLQEKENYKEASDFREVDSIKRGYDILPHFEHFLESEKIQNLLENDQKISIEIAETIKYFSTIYRKKDFDSEKTIEWLMKAKNIVERLMVANTKIGKKDGIIYDLRRLNASIMCDLGLMFRELEYRKPKKYQNLLSEQKVTDPVVMLENALLECKVDCDDINAAIRHELAVALINRNNYVEAKKQLENSLKISDKETAYYVRALSYMGYVNVQLKKYKEAEQNLHSVENILKNKNLTRTREMGTVYYFLGYYYNKITKYNLAIKYLTDAAEIREKIADMDPRLIKINFEIGYAYEKLTENQKAITFYKKAIDIANVRLESTHEDIIELKNKLSALGVINNIEKLLGAKTINKKILIISAGLAGTGKTAHLKYLSRKVSNSVYLGKDIISSILLQGKPYFSDYYNQYVKMQSYEVMLALARDNLERDTLVILDGSFGDKLTSGLLKNYLNSQDFVTKVIYFHCSGNKQLDRLRSRGDGRDSDKLQEGKFIQYRQEHIKNHLVNLAKTSHLMVDTERDEDLEKNIEMICKFLETPKTANITYRFDKDDRPLSPTEAMQGADGFSSLLKLGYIK